MLNKMHAIAQPWAGPWSGLGPGPAGLKSQVILQEVNPLCIALLTYGEARGRQGPFNQPYNKMWLRRNGLLEKNLPEPSSLGSPHSSTSVQLETLYVAHLLSQLSPSCWRHAKITMGGMEAPKDQPAGFSVCSLQMSPFPLEWGVLCYRIPVEA